MAVGTPLGNAVGGSSRDHLTCWCRRLLQRWTSRWRSLGRIRRARVKEVFIAHRALPVNCAVVRWAGQFLYELFSTGLLRQHGVVVNLDAKRCGPIDVDPAVWKRFGVRRRRPRGLSEN